MVVGACSEIHYTDNRMTTSDELHDTSRNDNSQPQLSKYRPSLLTSQMGGHDYKPLCYLVGQGGEIYRENKEFKGWDQLTLAVWWSL